MLFHICHLSATFDTFLSPVFNWGVHLLMLLQCKGGEELLFTVITHEAFFFAVLYPMMPFHVKRLLSANLTFGADFCLVLELDMPGELVAFVILSSCVVKTNQLCAHDFEQYTWRDVSSL